MDCFCHGYSRRYIVIPMVVHDSCGVINCSSRHEGLAILVLWALSGAIVKTTSGQFNFVVTTDFEIYVDYGAVLVLGGMKFFIPVFGIKEIPQYTSISWH